MSRDIKLRLWDKQAKKMLYYDKDIVPNMTLNGVLVEPMPALIDGKETTIEGNVSFKYEIMQYTGLKGKHFQEIYEGDIVIDRWGNNRVVEIGPIFHSDYEDTFAGCGFGFSTHELEDFTNYVEVIGNIYENPELLTNSTKQK